MKTSSVKEIKHALNYYEKDDLIKLCLRLSKFKKENKEMLSYILNYENDEDFFIETIKEDISLEFCNVNTDSVFYAKKTVRKILRLVKRYSKYTTKKSTEIELLLCFCEHLVGLIPKIDRNTILKNLLDRQKQYIEKEIIKLHEDLKFDYSEKLNDLLG